MYSAFQPHGRPNLVKDYLVRPDVLRRLEKFLLLAQDFGLLMLTYGLGTYARFGHVSFGHLFSAHFYLVLFFTVSSLYVFELYSNTARLNISQLSARMLAALVLSFAAISFFLYVAGAQFFVGNFVGRGVLGVALLSFSLLTLMSRFFLSKLLRELLGGQNCLLVGSLEETNRMLEAIPENSIGQVQVLNLDESPESREKILQELQGPWAMIVAGDELVRFKELKDQLIQQRLSGKNLLLAFEFYEKHIQKIPVQLINEEWTLRYGGFGLLNNPIGLRAKRLLDILAAMTLLLLTLPIFILLPIVMKLTERGDIFYRQTRVGHRGRHFQIIKYRTMVPNAESSGAQWSQTGDSRITKLGAFLRKTRIDELPQLFCVLKGDMSLIGPRPERPEFTEELAKVIPFYDLRHLVKPGITGWAQVKYPYGASIEDAIRKLEFDLYYIKNYSLVLDLTIVLKTVRVVFSRAGR